MNISKDSIGTWPRNSLLSSTLEGHRILGCIVNGILRGHPGKKAVICCCVVLVGRAPLCMGLSGAGQCVLWFWGVAIISGGATMYCVVCLLLAKLFLVLSLNAWSGGEQYWAEATKSRDYFLLVVAATADFMTCCLAVVVSDWWSLSTTNQKEAGPPPKIITTVLYQPYSSAFTHIWCVEFQQVGCSWCAGSLLA